MILLITGLKSLWIEPATRWFRLRSPVEAPAMMQHPVGAQFANGIELIGYDIRRDAVRQGGQLWSGSIGGHTGRWRPISAPSYTWTRRPAMSPGPTRPGCTRATSRAATGRSSSTWWTNTDWPCQRRRRPCWRPSAPAGSMPMARLCRPVRDKPQPQWEKSA